MAGARQTPLSAPRVSVYPRPLFGPHPVANIGVADVGLQTLNRVVQLESSFAPGEQCDMNTSPSRSGATAVVGTELTLLTVRQPWASLLLSGEDWCENRRWHTDHRGPLWIHSSSTVDVAACRAWGIDPESLVTGSILGRVELVEVLPLGELRAQQEQLAARWNLNLPVGRPFIQGPWCWIVAHPRALAQPIRTRGALYLWKQRVGSGAFAGWRPQRPLLPSRDS